MLNVKQNVVMQDLAPAPAHGPGTCAKIMWNKTIVSTKYLATISLALSFLLGCSFINPNENFRDALRNTIGRDIDNIPSYQWPHEEDLMNVKALPNGNEEREYKYFGTCRLFFEVSPITRKIVSSRSEGNIRDCVIVP